MSASAGKTWDAVIDAFAAANIPIKNMERASGFISTDPLSIGRDAALEYADCGKAIGIAIPATQATYNVLVRGDSTAATVKATVRWVNVQEGPYGNGRNNECSSRGAWERDFESRVKARAEGRAIGAP